jgi:protein involved in polysaccharide export with SLBB domain
MKKLLILSILVLAAPALVAAQAQNKDPKSKQPDDAGATSTAVRERVVGTNRVANHAEKTKPNVETNVKTSSSPDSAANTPRTVSQATTQPKWGNTTVTVGPNSESRALSENSQPSSKVVEQSSQPTRKLVQQTVLAAETSKPSINNLSAPKSLEPSGPASTVVYRVGVGDVLDIRLTNLPTRESTLYTVLRNGVLEYPLLSGPLSVAGMTTDEIARLLSNEIKVLKAARVSVSVRDYASHTVLVTGLVNNPGQKMLRREAMPLFVVLAEALPRSEAVNATIVRDGKSQTIELTNEQAMATLILPGDSIKVSGRESSPTRFVYVGGEVASRGEKEFRDGMTLTQAILSAGGEPRGAKMSVRVARRDSKGFLKSVDYNLQTIQEGKAQDPLLEVGDRIEVTRSM